LRGIRCRDRHSTERTVRPHGCPTSGQDFQSRTTDGASNEPACEWSLSAYSRGALRGFARPPESSFCHLAVGSGQSDGVSACVRPNQAICRILSLNDRVLTVVPFSTCHRFAIHRGWSARRARPGQSQADPCGRRRAPLRHRGPARGLDYLRGDRQSKRRAGARDEPTKAAPEMDTMHFSITCRR
jgi:hypothetical protein